MEEEEEDCGVHHMRPDTWEDLSLTKLRNNLSESLRNVLKAKRYFNDRLGSIYPSVQTVQTGYPSLPWKEVLNRRKQKRKRRRRKKEEEG